MAVCITEIFSQTTGIYFFRAVILESLQVKNWAYCLFLTWEFRLFQDSSRCHNKSCRCHNKSCFIYWEKGDVQSVWKVNIQVGIKSSKVSNYLLLRIFKYAYLLYLQMFFRWGFESCKCYWNNCYTPLFTNIFCCKVK